MTQFVYRLQLLLEQKEEARKEAEAELLRREQELEQQKARLVALQQNVTNLMRKRDQLRVELMTGTGGANVRGHEVQDRSTYLQVMGLDIEEAKNQVLLQQVVIEQCDRRVKDGKQCLADARREVEVLTKHRSKQEERFVRELQMKEELALDEIGNVIYTTRRSSQ